MHRVIKPFYWKYPMFNNKLFTELAQDLAFNIKRHLEGKGGAPKTEAPLENKNGVDKTMEPSATTSGESGEEKKGDFPF
jgi:hypothetical protein